MTASAAMTLGSGIGALQARLTRFEALAISPRERLTWPHAQLSPQGLLYAERGKYLKYIYSYTYNYKKRAG
jgi:hypothetical protein